MPSENRVPEDSLNVVLTKELNSTMYALAIRTTTDMVFDTKYHYTLTEMLTDISNYLTRNQKKIAGVSEAFEALMKDCPEEFNTLSKIWDYVNVNGDPESDLIQLINSKQAKEEGKGLSTNDFTDILKEKLENGYSKEELDEKFALIMDREDRIEERVSELEKRPNIVISQGTTMPEEVRNGDYWYQIITLDNGVVFGKGQRVIIRQ